MNFSGNRSIYLQIADHICENILTGEIEEGTKIASVREMASSIEVNPNTVQRSFTWLQEHGILYNQRGIGYFVEKDAFQKVKAMRRENFITEELPDLFKSMELLGMDFDDLKQTYQRIKDQI